MAPPRGIVSDPAGVRHAARDRKQAGVQPGACLASPLPPGARSPFGCLSLSLKPPTRRVSLAKVKLRTPHDAIALCRQTRSAAQEFGLHPRDVSGFSAATYATAQALGRYSGVTAALTLSEGPSLQIAFRIPLPDTRARSATLAQLTPHATALRSMVDDIQLEQKGSRVVLRLRSVFSSGAVGRLPRSGRQPGDTAVSHPDDRDIPAGELRRRYLQLCQAYAELQEELQETNRGVVALHAELERDIAQRKRLEDDLRRRAQELDAANRAKEEFLATLSHELRTPLNAMLGWTRLLRMGKLAGTAMARALETIERNAHIQEQLIADILDVSRIVTGKLRLELRPIELAPVVAAALDAIRPGAEAKGIRLVSDGTFDGSVLGDPDRLQQVIWNLVVNAIKFTPPGGCITVTLGQPGASAVVTVTDTGEGIAPELLPFIFDRFTQGDTSLTRPHGGLGLGLSIVRHIVELHGGKVQVHSDGKGAGATFSVHLPIRTLNPSEHVEVQPAPRAVAGLFVVEQGSDRRQAVRRRAT